MEQSSRLFGTRPVCNGGVAGAVFAGGGALIGILGQGVGDLVSGHLSSWQNYAAAAGVML